MTLTILLIFGFLVSLALLLVSVRYAQKRWHWHPELARKSVHMLMGISCLLFPFMFDAVWPVWVLVALSLSLLFAVRYSKKGRDVMGDALHAVQRKSLGELWFTLAVVLVFTLAFYEQQPILYWIPILILAFSDAAAALIGVRYGQFKFIASDGMKSIEGSTAFAITCFFLVAFPLSIVSDASALTVLLVSLILGLLIMLVEGASWKGIDNLLIPIGAFFLLRNYLQFSELELTLHATVLIVLIVAFVWLRKRTFLDGSGLLGVILLCFFYWSLGGVEWLLAPVLYFLLYNYFARRRGQTERYIHDIKSVLSIGGVSTMCLLGYLTWPNDIWITGFAAAFAAQLTITGLARREHFAQEYSRTFNAFMAWLQGTVYILLPCSVLFWVVEISFVTQWFLCSTLGLLLCLLLFSAWQPAINNLPLDSSRWWRQGLTGLLPSGMGIIGSTGFLGYL